MHPNAVLNQARRHHRAGRWRAALEAYCSLPTPPPALQPDDALAIANCHLHLGETAQARNELKTLAAAHPDYWPAYYNLGLIAEQAGDRGTALACYRRAVQAAPANGEVWQKLASTQHFTRHDDPDLVMMLDCMKRCRDEEGRERLHFALAKAYDDLDEPASAMSHLVAAHRLKQRHLQPFDLTGAVQRMQAIATAFTTLPPCWPGPGPLFIIGMPRTGTTLLERMLGRHPKITALGERPWFNDQIWSVFPAFPHDIAPSAAVQFKAFGQRAREYYSSLALTPWFTDKFPGNFIYLGLIATVLPESRFIYLDRDPRDACLSIYQQDFDRGHPYAHRLEDLVRYWQAHSALMQHWFTIAGDRLHRVEYETLCNTPEVALRELCAWFGAIYDPNMLDFHHSPDVVKTASQWQVREPLHQRSIGRWRKYAPWLQPLIHTFGNDDTPIVAPPTFDQARRTKQ